MYHGRCAAAPLVWGGCLCRPVRLPEKPREVAVSKLVAGDRGYRGAAADPWPWPARQEGDGR